MDGRQTQRVYRKEKRALRESVKVARASHPSRRATTPDAKDLKSGVANAEHFGFNSIGLWELSKKRQRTPINMKTKIIFRLAVLVFWLTTSTVFAQTGLPLNFSPLSNPLPTPQSYYLESDPNIPLGDKTPLILIHGIDFFSGTPAASAHNWDNFCIWFYSTPSIRNRFKIYRFDYQSNQSSVQTLGNYLAQLLNANDGSATDQKLAGKDIVILAHSMGGLVARRFMEEQRQTKASKWNQSALRLITLATPHHGTPAANRCDPPGYVGALGYKLAYELGSPAFASAASSMSSLSGIFYNAPSYNQPNRSDLLWDNYDSLFTLGFSPGEANPSTATLNSISSAQSYDSKIITYAGNIANGSFIHSGHDATLSTTADILANGLRIPSDGIVPIDSAWFQNRISNSQLRFFDDYDHYQMMQSKTVPGDLPSLTDPLFTMIGSDLTSALPVVTPATITSVSPATLPPSSSPQLITINGTNFKLPGDPNASSLVFYDPANTSYPRTPINVTATSMQYNITVQSATGTWRLKVVNGGVESLPFSFSVSSGSAQLTGLSISGPATVNENTSGQFTAKAIFSDGSNPTVTPTWSVSGPASIAASGQLSASSVNANTAVTVSASYTTGGITKTATANATVVDTGAICGYQYQQIIVNPNFASGGSGWTLTGAFQADSRFATCRSCPGYAYLANADGSAGNNLSGVLSQTFTIPGNAVEAALDFWDRTTTTETKGNFIDRLNVRLRLSNNSQVGLADIWNSSANTAYTQHSIDLINYKGQTVTLEFAGTTDANGPTAFRIDDVTLNVTTTIPPTPVSLVISGPSSVTEGGSGQYNATMIYCDGTTANVSALNWGNNIPSVVSFTSGGLLTAGLVNQDTVVSIYTTATVNGQNYQAFKDVTVVNQTVTFSSLAISGPSSMNENSSGQFTATALFSDGSSQSVSPTWSENSSVTTISSGGLLTAGDVNSDTTVTVSASYTTGGITRNASQDVLVVNTPPPVTLSSLSISGPNSMNENSTAQYTATAFFSDGSSQGVNPIWSEDSAATGISIFGLLSAGEVVGDTSVTISASYTTGGVTRNAQKSVTVINITVTPTYTLTVNASNGTVTKNPDQENYTSGIQVLLTATPAGGYQFNTWSGDVTGSQNPLTLTMTANKNITANFVVVPSSLKQLTGMHLSNSVIRFSLNGPVGSNYVVQVSSNLVDWVNRYVKTIPGGGAVIVSETLAGYSRRFYRAVTNDQGPFVLQPGPIDSKDIWTTSTYSYAPGDSFPGGGLNEYQLRVGGWYDLYYALLQFDLTDLPTNATSAVLYLYCFSQSGGGTPLYLDRITQSWDWRTQGTGRDYERLWWADKPTTSLWNVSQLPTPSVGQWYAVDITTLYNAWQSGTYPNYGLQFRPVLNNNNNFNNFYSSDYAGDSALRPKLVITK